MDGTGGDALVLGQEPPPSPVSAASIFSANHGAPDTMLPGMAECSVCKAQCARKLRVSDPQDASAVPSCRDLNLVDNL